MPDNWVQSLTDDNFVIANRYRLQQSLGRGGFGEVFKAEDLKFSPPKTVALKLIHPRFLAEYEVVQASIREEASVLARFNHPNILRVIDFDISPTLAYIITDLAEGGSLSHKIRPDPTKPPVRMPLPEVANYLEQLASALDEAHRQGLVHRDIKPQNILLDSRGRPLLADFGLAATLSTSQASAILIETTTSGTPLYMAPEQWLGQVGKATDIYALGMVVFQLITGQTAYSGNQTMLAHQHQHAPIPRLGERAPGLQYPPALDAVLAEVLAKTPQQRTRPAMEFYRRFKAALDGQPITINTPDAELSQTRVINTGTGPANYQVDQPTQPITPPSQPGASYSAYAQPPTGGSYPPPASVSTSYPAPVPAQIKLTLSGPLKWVIGVGLALVVVLIGLLVLNLFAPKAAGVTFQVANTYIQPAGVNSIALNPAGTVLASGDNANNIRLYEVPNAKEIATLSGHTGQVLSLSFSPDGKILASGSQDNTVKLWDTATGKELNTLTGHNGAVNSVAFSHHSNILASGGADSTIILWDATTGKKLNTLKAHNGGVNVVAFSPDDKTLASGSEDKSVKVWNVADIINASVESSYTGHTDRISTLAYSPDGKTIASGSEDKTIKLSRADNGADENVTFVGHTDEVASVVFSSDGKTLISAGDDKTVKAWEVASGKQLANLADNTDAVTTLAYAADGKTLISGSLDKSIKVIQLNPAS
jgi:serine/threonine protein kinase